MGYEYIDMGHIPGGGYKIGLRENGRVVMTFKGFVDKRGYTRMMLYPDRILHPVANAKGKHEISVFEIKGGKENDSK